MEKYLKLHRKKKPIREESVKNKFQTKQDNM